MAKQTKKAKKVGKAKKAATKTTKPKGDFTKDARVMAIIAECKAAVLQGASPKTFDPAADRLLTLFFGPKILTRKKQKDDWDDPVPPVLGAPSVGNVKDRPLRVAYHLGQICAILCAGTVVSKKVALVAAKAAQKDETCTNAQGRGDWCA